MDKDTFGGICVFTNIDSLRKRFDTMEEEQIEGLLFVDAPEKAYICVTDKGYRFKNRCAKGEQVRICIDGFYDDMDAFIPIENIYDYLYMLSLCFTYKYSSGTLCLDHIAAVTKGTLIKYIKFFFKGDDRYEGLKSLAAEFEPSDKEVSAFIFLSRNNMGRLSAILDVFDKIYPNIFCIPVEPKELHTDIEDYVQIFLFSL